MQGTKIDPCHAMRALAMALVVALPMQAWAARPGAKDRATRQAVSRQAPVRASAKDMAMESATKKTGASDDAARRPYRPLVDSVQGSSDAFREDNTSENEERDRLEVPPPR